MVNIRNETFKITQIAIALFFCCCKIEKKGCGLANQETRIVGGKPTGVNVRLKSLNSLCH